MTLCRCARLRITLFPARDRRAIPSHYCGRRRWLPRSLPRGLVQERDRGIRGREVLERPCLLGAGAQAAWLKEEESHRAIAASDRADLPGSLPVGLVQERDRLRRGREVPEHPRRRGDGAQAAWLKEEESHGAIAARGRADLPDSLPGRAH